VTPVSIYRIVAADVWQRAEAAGTFAGTEHDLREVPGNEPKLCQVIGLRVGK
jgi:uncharacterized protein (DUF952 family)